MDIVVSTSATVSGIQINNSHIWDGFKLIGDNIDKNRSFQRLNYTTQSLHYFHYFHTYALLDTVDFSGLSDEPPKGEINFNTLLPNDEDMCKLKREFCCFSC